MVFLDAIINFFTIKKAVIRPIGACVVIIVPNAGGLKNKLRTCSSVRISGIKKLCKIRQMTAPAPIPFIAQYSLPINIRRYVDSTPNSEAMTK